MPGLLQDTRLAVRTLVASPLVTAVAVLTLAVTIGASTAVFSVVNSLLLRSLPVADPERLVWVSSDYATDHGFRSGAGWTYEMWRGLQERAGFAAGALAWQSQTLALGDAGRADPVNGLYVSGEFFNVLGVHAQAGRLFRPDDDRPGRGTGLAGVISHRLWQRRFNSAQEVVGSEILVNHVPVTVIGVAPPQFTGLEVGKAFDIALPFSAEPVIAGKNAALFKSRQFTLLVMLRLRPGQSMESATQTLRGMQAQIVPSDAPEFAREPFTLVAAAGGASTPASAQQVYRQPLLLMLAGVGLVLVIACVNIANLLLARAIARRGEFSVRQALGASRWRLARGLLVESLLLAGAGSVLGLVLAHWMARAIVALSPVALDPVLDWRVAGFVGAAAIVTLILSGVAPAWRATRVGAVESLRGTQRTLVGGRGRLSDGLVVLQISLAIVTVVAAGLLVRTFTHLTRRPLGFDRDRVLVANVDLSRIPGDASGRIDLSQRLSESVSRAPGVERAAASIWTPLGGGGLVTSLRPVGAAPESKPISMIKNMVSPDWLPVYGTDILEGRDFTAADAATAPPAAIVNQAYVRQFLAGRAAVGEMTPDKRLIVGVAADAVFRSSQRIPGVSSLALREPVAPTMYVPLAQTTREERPPSDSIRISVRSSGSSPATLAQAVGAALHAVDPRVTFEARTLADVVRESLGQERMTAWLAMSFGVVALLLAMLGLYGVTAYAVSRRQAEMGVRMALGATAGDVKRLVLYRAWALLFAGVIAGLAAATWLTRWLSSLLFGVAPVDLPTFLGLSAVLVAVGTIAALVPAHRASRVDPSVALRGE
jgi:putative ABC transport system permease protein